MAELHNKGKEKEMQEKYMEFQMLDRQIKQVQGQIEQLESQINELVYLQQSLAEMKDVKVGKEMFVPLGAGIFINAELKNNSEVLVNVGGGVIVKKPIAGAAQILENNIKELRGFEQERARVLSDLSQSAAKLESELAKFVGVEQ